LLLKHKLILSAGMDSDRSIYINEISLKNNFIYSANGSFTAGNYTKKREAFKTFPVKVIGFAIAFAVVNLFFSNTAFASTRRVTGVTSYGGQVGSATYGTGTSSITYTITLTEAGTTAGAADNILLTWASGTPTGVTYAFSSSTETPITNTTFFPSGGNGSIITLTITTSNNTPAGSDGFTIKITDNNAGGGPYSSAGLSLVVTQKALTITGLTANNKTYDRTTTATLAGTATLNGVIAGDVVNLGGAPTSVFASANVGVGIAVTVTGYTISGASAGNYTLTQPSGLTANITAKTLTVTLVSASNKVYDGTTTATVTGGVLSGVILFDVVSVSTTGTFASANVGTGILVTVALTGANAGNYTLTQPGITANITVATLTITANNIPKVYGTLLTGGPGSIAFTSSGLKNGETIGSVTMAYGAGSAITAPVGTNTGTAVASAATGGTFTASNYSISYVAGNITVTAKALTITGISANNKVYDGTTTATLSGTATLNGVVGADVVTLGGAPTAVFASKNVGIGIAVTVSGYTIGGANAGNYTLTQPAGLTANITALALTVTGAAASNKVYDGTTAATITGTLSGVIGGDVVTLSGTGTFASSSAGNGIAVTSTSTLGGANAGDYTLTQPTGLTANITPAPLTITGLTASNKSYDGTTTASLTGSGSLSGIIGSDVVILGGTGTAVFASKNVATGIAVTVTGYSIGGAQAGDYTVSQPSGLTANITTAALTISATGPLKAAGSTSPVITGSTTNFIYYGTVNGETVTSVTLTPNPTSSQTAGSTYTVTPSAAAGANGFVTSNYSITYFVYNGVCSGHTYTWAGTTSITWSTGTNWSPNGTPSSTDDVIIPSGTTRAPTVTSSTSVNTLTYTGNNTITVNSGINLTINNGFAINSGVTAANVVFVGSSASTQVELSSAIFTNYGTFNVSGTGLIQVDNTGSYIFNSGTFTASGNTTLYLQGGTNVTHALTNAGTFYAGTSSSNCNIEVDDYGSIDNSGTFYMGPTTLMYYYNDNAQYVIINNQNGGTFTLQSNANGSASIGEVPQGRNNAFTGTFNVERYFQGGTTITSGRYVERDYRIISSPVNTGTTVDGNYVFGLNYIVGSTAGQTTAANSTTNAFITGCTGGSTSAGNPSVYLYNESKTPANFTYTDGNFLGITDITNSTTGGTITASDGGTYSMPVGTGVFFFFRGAANQWTTRTHSPYIAPENVTLTSTGNMNVGSYTFKDWYAPSITTLGYSGSGAGTNFAVRGFNMIGNPYQCPIDWCTSYSGSGMVRTNINPTIWVYDPVVEHYWTFLATGTNSGTATGNASRYIAAGQGFFVQASTTSPALTISEYAKSVLNANATVGTGALPAGAQLTGSGLLMSTTPLQAVIPQSLRLKLIVDSINYDDTYIGFSSTATPNYNPIEDSEYLPGNGPPESLASFSADNVKLAINNLPLPKQTAQVIKLHVGGTATGLYTLKRTAIEAIPKIYEVWLMDKYKKDSLDIRNNSTYKFNIKLTDTTSYGNNRFQVIIRQNPALGVHLLNFAATKATNGAQIVWVTENEENYTNFTVERSIDGGATFTVLGGYLSSALGTYSLLDKDPAAEDQYRLKIEDLNGTITYSNIVTLMYANSSSLVKNNISVYPNPAQGTLNLMITLPFISNQVATQSTGSFANPLASVANNVYGIRIVNSTGSIIKSATTTQQDWQTDVSSLTPGTYILQVINNYDNSVVGKSTFVKL